MQNIEDVVKLLSANYEDVRNDRMELAKSKELTNITGKILSAVSLKLKYNVFTKKTDSKIKFLED